MPKIDLKKEFKALYQASAKDVTAIDVPVMNFLMIDGRGDPNISKDFQAAIEALYSVSYTLKFMVKKEGLGDDYVVLPLEGLWWADDMTDFLKMNKNLWYWTAMIRQPDFITEQMYNRAKEAAARKKDLPLLSKMRFEKLVEGKAAQIMHIGPFSTEGPTIEKISAFIARGGHKIRGKHHEIYLSDFRKTASEKQKTVIRQPFA